MAATATLRVYTGTNAGTQSSAQTAIALMDIDSSAVTPANDVAPGSNSFEKWLRVVIDTAASTTFSNFWIERNGDLPDGVVVKMGVTDTPATPVASTSAVATTTMADGRRYLFDANEYDTNGDASRYVVLQGQVAADADAGAIEQQAFTVGWQQS